MRTHDDLRRLISSAQEHGLSFTVGDDDRIIVSGPRPVFEEFVPLLRANREAVDAYVRVAEVLRRAQKIIAESDAQRELAEARQRWAVHDDACTCEDDLAKHFKLGGSYGGWLRQRKEET